MPFSDCHQFGHSACVSFIVTPYSPDASGRMEPRPPSSCPYREEDEPACPPSLHSWRERTTGPEYPLRVMWCGVHGRHFTLYPPGYAPWQREAVSRVASDGGRVQGLSAGADGFKGTLFEAALDASAEVAWARQGPSDKYWGTQGRRLELIQRLCGVAPGLADPVRDLVAETLRVDGLLLREEAEALRGLGGYRQRGMAVRAVLDVLARAQPSDERLLHAGFVVGAWGLPQRWDPVAGVLRTRPFPGGGTRAPPRSG